MSISSPVSEFSAEKLFEIMYGRTTDGTCLYYKLPRVFGLGELSIQVFANCQPVYDNSFRPVCMYRTTLTHAPVLDVCLHLLNTWSQNRQSIKCQNHENINFVEKLYFFILYNQIYIAKHILKSLH